MKKNLKYLEIKKYQNHKKIFRIKNNSVLSFFEQLLKKTNNFGLECSVKIENTNILPARFLVCYSQKKYNTSIAHFFKKLNSKDKHFNYNFFKKFYNFVKKIKPEKIKELIAAIDARENFNDSRVKYYLSTEGFPELFNQILKVHGYNKNIADLVFNSNLIIGFDFCFNNIINMKIYLPLDSSYLNNFIIQKKLGRIFSKKINRLISKSDKIYLSFAGNNFKRIITFYPKNPKSFIFSLKNKKLNEIYKKIKFNSQRYISLSLKEEEINKNCLKNINLYYA